MIKKNAHPDDPRDLIGESYRIEGIGPEDHPMSVLLREAIAAGQTKRGRTGRRRNRAP